MTRLFGVVVATILAAFLSQAPAKAMNECDDLFNQWSDALDNFISKHHQAENYRQQYEGVTGTDMVSNYSRESYYQSWQTNAYLADAWLDTAFGLEDQMWSKNCLAR